MKIIFSLFVLILFSSFIIAQEGVIAPEAFELKALSIEEQEELMKLPELKLPAAYKGKSLPAMVDNSTQPYMREVFQQHMNELDI